MDDSGFKVAGGVTVDDSGVTVTNGGGDITNGADATGLKVKSSQATFTKEVLLLHAKDTTGFDLIKGVVDADSGSGTTKFKVDAAGKVTAAGGMTIESTGLKVAGGATLDDICLLYTSPSPRD